MTTAATVLPLAPAQRGIWFLHSLAPDSSVYNVPVALRVRGPLDPAALDGALAALARRHQVLRTTFADRDGSPVQVVQPPSAAPPVVARWVVGPGRGLAAASAEAGRLAAEPFDIAAGPLWRVGVVPVGPDDHAVMFAFHHIVLDEVSAAVLARDLRAAYLDPGSLSEVDGALDYVSFCRSLQGGPDEEGLRYWRDRLAEPVPVLPAERAGGGRLFRGDRVRFTVDAATARLLATRCARWRVSPFMVFHAVLAVLLHGWTGESRLAIGSPMGGRADDRFAETVGFFQNTVVLPAAVDPAGPFTDVLAASRRSVLEALPHQQIPFEAVVAAVRPDRAGTRNPLFQAALVFNRVKVEREWALDGLDVTPLPFDWPMAHFDLTVTLTQDAGDLAGELAYDTDRFHRATAEDLATTFTTLLATVLADADTTVADAPRPRPLHPATTPTHPTSPTSLTSTTSLTSPAPLASPVVPAAPAAAGQGGQVDALCRLFADVLGVDGIEPDDNFFELGGHSLLAGRLVSRIRAELGADLGLRDLFEAPTSATLAPRLLPTIPPDPAPASPAPGTPVPAGSVSVAAGGAGAARERPARVPLSYAQRGLWYLSRLEGAGATYNVPLVLRFGGGVRRGALRDALRDLVGRHESLRTVFPARDGEPAQVVLPAADAAPDLPVVEVTEEELAGRLRAAARQQFDLAARIPLRARLFALPTGDDVLLLLLHHIASDGWSLGPLGRDLAAAYAARCAGTAPGWPDLPIQYADHALRERDRLGPFDEEGSLAGRQLAYWRQALAGLPDELALPTDRPRPPVASYAGATVQVDWPPELHRAVTTLAHRSGATAFMVLQAGLAALLCRLGAGTDIPLGAPTAGRTDEDLAELVGYFVNTVVLRTDVGAEPTFADLVERVRQADLTAFAHQDVPFEAVVEAVNPVRSPARQPLFQVMLSFQRDVVASLALPGTPTSLGQTHTGVAKFDLSVNLQEFYHPDGAHAGIQGIVEYATDLFDAGTVTALVARLRRLLTAACAEPSRYVADLDILAPGEEHRLLVEWQGERRELPPGTLPDRFAAQAARTPDAPAVAHGTASLTYRELDDRTNRLARLLIARGAGPERTVAVALPRCTDLLVALLAVLRSGAAYLPLDPDQPPARSAGMLADATPLLVLTSTAIAGRLPDPAPPTVLLDTDPAAGQPAAPVTGRATDRTAAYVLFTSGSTGRPKGVVVEHRSLSLYLACVAEVYPGLDGRALVPTPVTFDLTLTGLFGPLVTGGCVHLAALDEPAPPATHLKVTPSHLALLVATPPAFAATGTVVAGGEVLTGAALRDWRDRHPHSTVINEYGPTEATIGCLYHVIRPGEPVPAGPLPVGRPLWNTRVYVLDPRGRPAPAGVPGELHVAGGLLARGYLHRPDLTAERFVPDPYGPPGSRMYRTGDLARWTPAGLLEYLGRLDDQLKVRGYRIEPAEIEAVLTTHPTIREAAVTARADRLLAYAVPTHLARADEGGRSVEGTGRSVEGAGLPIAEIRAYLAARLPAYLIPAEIIALPALPLSANGKVDRAALPAPHATAARRGRPPRTATERGLLGLFADVLDRPDTGVDDDFFALGGHSLLAVRLAARIHQDLHHEVSLTTLLTHPTIATLAAVLDGNPQPAPTLLRPTSPVLRPAGEGHRAAGEGRRVDGDGHRPAGDGHGVAGDGHPVASDGRVATLALMHPVGGTLLCYRELVAALPAGGPIVGCERLPGAHPVEESLEELADRHAAALCQGTPDGPVTVAGWSVGGVVAHAVAGRLLARGREVAGLILIDSLMPRTAADRDAVRASASRLREAVRDPDQPAAATLLRQYGLAPDLLAGTAGERWGEPSATGVQPGRQAGAGRPAGTGAPAGPGGQVGEVVADWGRLLELVAAYRGGAVAVPGLLVVAGGNPGELPRRIEGSWAGLCAALRVREVGGDHLSVLRWPAVREVAEAMSGG